MPKINVDELRKLVQEAVLKFGSRENIDDAFEILQSDYYSAIRDDYPKPKKKDAIQYAQDKLFDHVTTIVNQFIESSLTNITCETEDYSVEEIIPCIMRLRTANLKICSSNTDGNDWLIPEKNFLNSKIKTVVDSTIAKTNRNPIDFASIQEDLKKLEFLVLFLTSPYPTNLETTIDSIFRALIFLPTTDVEQKKELLKKLEIIQSRLNGQSIQSLQKLLNLLEWISVLSEKSEYTDTKELSKLLISVRTDHENGKMNTAEFRHFISRFSNLLYVQNKLPSTISDPIESLVLDILSLTNIPDIKQSLGYWEEPKLNGQVISIAQSKIPNRIKQHRLIELLVESRRRQIPLVIHTLLRLSLSSPQEFFYLIISLVSYLKTEDDRLNILKSTIKQLSNHTGTVTRQNTKELEQLVMLSGILKIRPSILADSYQTILQTTTDPSVFKFFQRLKIIKSSEQFMTPLIQKLFTSEDLANSETEEKIIALLEAMNSEKTRNECLSFHPLLAKNKNPIFYYRLILLGINPKVKNLDGAFPHEVESTVEIQRLLKDAFQGNTITNPALIATAQMLDLDKYPSDALLPTAVALPPQNEGQSTGGGGSKEEPHSLNTDSATLKTQDGLLTPDGQIHLIFTRLTQVKLPLNEALFGIKPTVSLLNAIASLFRSDKPAEQTRIRALGAAARLFLLVNACTDHAAYRTSEVTILKEHRLTQRLTDLELSILFQSKAQPEKNHPGVIP